MAERTERTSRTGRTGRATRATREGRRGRVPGLESRKSVRLKREKAEEERETLERALEFGLLERRDGEYGLAKPLGEVSERGLSLLKSLGLDVSRSEWQEATKRRQALEKGLLETEETEEGERLALSRKLGKLGQKEFDLLKAGGLDIPEKEYGKAKKAEEARRKGLISEKGELKEPLHEISPGERQLLSSIGLEIPEGKIERAKSIERAKKRGLISGEGELKEPLAELGEAERKLLSDVGMDISEEQVQEAREARERKRALSTAKEKGLVEETDEGIEVTEPITEIEGGEMGLLGTLGFDVSEIRGQKEKIREREQTFEKLRSQFEKGELSKSQYEKFSEMAEEVPSWEEYQEYKERAEREQALEESRKKYEELKSKYERGELSESEYKKFQELAQLGSIPPWGRYRMMAGGQRAYKRLKERGVVKDLPEMLRPERQEFPEPGRSPDLRKRRAGVGGTAGFLGGLEEAPEGFDLDVPSQEQVKKQAEKLGIDVGYMEEEEPKAEGELETQGKIEEPGEKDYYNVKLEAAGGYVGGPATKTVTVAAGSRFEATQKAQQDNPHYIAWESNVQRSPEDVEADIEAAEVSREWEKEGLAELEKEEIEAVYPYLKPEEGEKPSLEEFKSQWERAQAVEELPPEAVERTPEGRLKLTYETGYHPAMAGLFGLSRMPEDTTGLEALGRVVAGDVPPSPKEVYRQQKAIQEGLEPEMPEDTTGLEAIGRVAAGDVPEPLLEKKTRGELLYGEPVSETPMKHLPGPVKEPLKKKTVVPAKPLGEYTEEEFEETLEPGLKVGREKWEKARFLETSDLFRETYEKPEDMTEAEWKKLSKTERRRKGETKYKLTKTPSELSIHEEKRLEKYDMMPDVPKGPSREIYEWAQDLGPEADVAASGFMLGLTGSPAVAYTPEGRPRPGGGEALGEFGGMLLGSGIGGATAVPTAIVSVIPGKQWGEEWLKGRQKVGLKELPKIEPMTEEQKWATWIGGGAARTLGAYGTGKALGAGITTGARMVGQPIGVGIKGGMTRALEKAAEATGIGKSAVGTGFESLAETAAAHPTAMKAIPWVAVGGYEAGRVGGKVAEGAEPGEIISHIATSAGTMAGMYSGVKAASKWDVPRLEYKAIGPEGESVYKGLFGRYKQTAKPLIGKTQQGYTLGTPEIGARGKGLLLESALGRPLSAYERPIYTKNVAPYERTSGIYARKGVLEVTSATRGATTPRVANSVDDLIDWKAYQRRFNLADDEIKAVKQAIRNTNKVRAYGSRVSERQMIGNLGRAKGDIDLEVPNPQQFSDELAKKISGAESRAGGGIVKGGNHFIDVHSLPEESLLSYSDEPFRAWGYQTEPWIGGRGGLKTMRLTEALTRKGPHSILRPKITPKGITYGPEIHREFKDVSDFLKFGYELGAPEKALSQVKQYGVMEGILEPGYEIATQTGATAPSVYTAGFPSIESLTSPAVSAGISAPVVSTDITGYPSGVSEVYPSVSPSLPSSLLPISPRPSARPSVVPSKTAAIDIIPSIPMVSKEPYIEGDISRLPSRFISEPSEPAPGLVSEIVSEPVSERVGEISRPSYEPVSEISRPSEISEVSEIPDVSSIIEGPSRVSEPSEVSEISGISSIISEISRPSYEAPSYEGDLPSYPPYEAPTYEGEYEAPSYEGEYPAYNFPTIPPHPPYEYPPYPTGPAKGGQIRLKPPEAKPEEEEDKIPPWIFFERYHPVGDIYKAFVGHPEDWSKREEKLDKEVQGLFRGKEPKKEDLEAPEFGFGGGEKTQEEDLEKIVGF